MAEVLLGLGANVGDTVANLRLAIDELGRECGVREVSSLYRTEPVGYEEQDWFLNAAAVVESALAPRGLLQMIARIEASAGRDRSIPNGPRTLDIDILLYRGDGAKTAVGPTLPEPQIPHPRMHLRRFVLEPAAEIAGDWVHPLEGRTLQTILAELPAGEAVERFTVLGWPPSVGP